MNPFGRFSPSHLRSSVPYHLRAFVTSPRSSTFTPCRVHDKRASTPVTPIQSDTSTPPLIPLSFHRRPLPDSLVAFSSPNGRALFKTAMLEEGLRSYFILAENYTTQSEPAFCGVATLSMCLNALGFDPGRNWKGPWRWYDDRMTECCVPLEQFEKSGMSFGEFGALARCNGAIVEEWRADTSSLEHFRQVLLSATSENPASDQTKLLVAAYDRPTLGQTGEGHFSPLAAYIPSLDMALIMDVARFKYPPHWVRVPVLWEAMRKINDFTGRSRGYFLLSAQAQQHPHACPSKISSWMRHSPRHCDCGDLNQAKQQQSAIANARDSE